MRFLQPSLAGSLLALAFTGAVARAAAIIPEPLPDPQIPGFTFPESEATLTRWITAMTRGDATTVAAPAFEKIHLHGWGLWTALTAETAQRHEDQRLRVFETWLTLDDLATPPPPPSPPPIAIATARATTWRRGVLRPFTVPKVRDLDALDDRERALAPRDASAGAAIDRVMGFVKFDPAAAAHIMQQQLLRTDTLNALLDGGATQIPPFPVTALAVKPLFQIIRVKDLVDGRYYALKAWPGPPATLRPWAPAHWPGSVWIDLANGGGGRGAVDALAMADGSSRTEETTYPISDLLHYRLSGADAIALNDDKPVPVAAPGDIAILVAMHVTSREIARWTWQTFWWSPSPADPLAPSSTAIANLRPPQLRGAARNYAMSLAYTMLSPDEPYVGGVNAAPAVYAYNPWLEARLAGTDLPDSRPGFAPDGQPAANNLGIQSNCMSCHAQANYNPNQRATAPRLTGARYVDLGAAEFVGTLQVDFLWSIARHAR